MNLSKVGGVEKVDVSLEKGLSTIVMKNENNATLQQLETVVRKSGFSPKKARVVFKGKLQSKDGKVTQAIVTGSQEILPATSKVASVESDKEYQIEGLLTIESNGNQSIEIESFK